MDFGTATLDDLVKRGPVNCDPASLQAVRLQVYQRSAVKDIRLVNRDGSVICSAYSETLEFDNGWADRSRDAAFAGPAACCCSASTRSTGSRLASSGISTTRIRWSPSSASTPICSTSCRPNCAAHSEVLLELNTGLEVGQFSQKPRGELADVVSFTHVSTHHPIHAIVRVERSVLAALEPRILLADPADRSSARHGVRPAADPGDREDRRPGCRYRQGSGAAGVQAVSTSRPSICAPAISADARCWRDGCARTAASFRR